MKLDIIGPQDFRKGSENRKTQQGRGHLTRANTRLIWWITPRMAEFIMSYGNRFNLTAAAPSSGIERSLVSALQSYRRWSSLHSFQQLERLGEHEQSRERWEYKSPPMISNLGGHGKIMGHAFGPE
jgi:hypothetical protein